jgi:cbb3-type cytochrome oxidase subunit 1
LPSCFFGTVGTRKVRHIYVANWFFGAFILAVAMLASGEQCGHSRRR